MIALLEAALGCCCGQLGHQMLLVLTSTPPGLEGLSYTQMARQRSQNGLQSLRMTMMKKRPKRRKAIPYKKDQ